MIETYNGVEVVAIEAPYLNSCEHCLFDDDDNLCEVACCQPNDRRDSKNVYFIRADSITIAVSIVKPKISKERIVELALKNGFTLKPQPDGVDALNPYVFDFVADLVKELE